MEFKAAFHVDDTGEKIGTLIISSTIDGKVKILQKGINITVEIESLKFVDKEQAFGLPQDALDNLATLAKDVISQLANNYVLDGFDVKLEDTTLSFLLINSKFAIIDHAFHISTDFAIPPSLLGNASSTICRRF
ncbi:unnamed protein product [Onchocerca flexuosa]|uniref:BPI2 domain-containing protein n=1 Tax=Onchocerca flexuosa TaxID=387005 RepID=A0A183HRB6_9BILA|nr:unnamed protein product [Onchocerca flexuosa]